MSNWRHLDIIEETNPQNPHNGLPYVLYNPNITKVWIFMGLHWILETGVWDENKSWSSGGKWNYYNENY